MGWLFRLIVGAAVVCAYCLALTIASVLAPAKAVDLTYALTHASAYAPPPCHRSPCVLTGPGGIWQVWRAHVNRNAALGRTFIVRGVCASSCERAARYAHARLMPGARLIPHNPTLYPTR